LCVCDVTACCVALWVAEWTFRWADLMAKNADESEPKFRKSALRGVGSRAAVVDLLPIGQTCCKISVVVGTHL